MEHRETPRMVTAEVRPRDARTGPSQDGRRFARFVTLPTERRLVLGRLAMALLAGTLGLVAVGGAGTIAWERMVRWLHGRPQYQTTFREIKLDPPPPSWFRGGAAVFLDRVRTTAQRPDEPFSALDLDLADLIREFRYYCWVKRVVKVERLPPNRIIVRLEYRSPVAWSAPLSKSNARLLLDEYGVMLPAEDVDEDRPGRLIQVIGLDPPFEPGPGLVWKKRDASQALGKADERVLATVKLAVFLRSKLEQEPTPVPPALRPVAIWVTTKQEKSFVFVQNAENTMILWAGKPGLETPGPQAADRRWGDLRDWFRFHSDHPPIQLPSYLDFSKDGVVIREGRS
jgi:hypothetical protein